MGANGAGKTTLIKCINGILNFKKGEVLLDEKNFNNVKYTWTTEWYRNAMNNFWIPEEINLFQDLKFHILLMLFQLSF